MRNIIGLINISIQNLLTWRPLLRTIQIRFILALAYA